MTLKVTGANLVNQILADRNKPTSRINQTHPDTKGWELELLPDGLLCTMRSGKLKLIPFTNIIELDVEEAAKPELKVKVKSKLVKAK